MHSNENIEENVNNFGELITEPNKSDKSSTNFYNNLTNYNINYLNLKLNSLNEKQIYCYNNQLEYNEYKNNSFSTRLYSNKNSFNIEVESNKLVNKKITSNLANFVSDTQLIDHKNTKKNSNCSLIWSNVNYKVNNSEINLKNPFSLFKKKEKLILNNVNGQLSTGELVALIGPSGVGKSSLLEILAGRRIKGTNGQIYINFEHDITNGNDKNFLKKNKLINDEKNLDKIAFVPQSDNHLGWLTVYETLIYASKLKNCKIAKNFIKKQQKIQKNLGLYLLQNSKIGHTSKQHLTQSEFFSSIKIEDEYHHTIVINILKDLSLESCMQTLVKNCSGGQLRRLSIALELLSQPRLILIDEPTTGLDFSSALKCIQTLRCLTMMSKPPGIIASIHQPSSLVLNQFHRVYALAKGGQCIYEGTVDNLVNHFNTFNIICPLYFNPADFSIQIANGDFGFSFITKLADHQTEIHKIKNNELILKSQNNSVFARKQTVVKIVSSDADVMKNYGLSSNKMIYYNYNVKNLMKDLNNKKLPTFKHIKLLLQRSWKCTIREPTLTWLRIFQFVFTAFLISNLHNYNVGENDGCFKDLTFNSSTNQSIDKTNLFENGEDYVQQLAKIKDNSILLFFSLMFWVMSSIIPTLLTFPNEMMVFIKERSNGWYSCFSYYMAKTLCDTPFVILCPFLFCSIFYPLTGQIMLWWRFALFYLVSLLLCLIAQSLGFIVGSIFIKDKFSAIFIGSVQSFPLFMIGGYLIRESVMNWLVKPLWYISYIRYSFSAIILSIYGFGRCESNSAMFHSFAQEQTKKTLLSQLREFIKEDDFNCMYDSYYTDSGYELDSFFKKCNLTIASLFSRTINEDTLKLSKRIENEASMYDNSFVLSYYEVTNDLFKWNIACLVLTLVFLKIINYSIILYNVKKHSKF